MWDTWLFWCDAFKDEVKCEECEGCDGEEDCVKIFYDGSAFLSLVMAYSNINNSVPTFNFGLDITARGGYMKLFFDKTPEDIVKEDLNRKIDFTLDRIAEYMIDGELNWQEIVRMIFDNSDIETLKGIHNAIKIALRRVQNQ